MQFRNHDIGVYYVDIACKLDRRFLSHVIEISVTECILLNIHIVRDLLSFSQLSNNPISGLSLRVTSSQLRPSYKRKSRDCLKASGATLNNMLRSSGKYVIRTVITNLKKRSTEKKCIFRWISCFTNRSISSYLLKLTTNIGYNLLFWFLITLSYYIHIRSFLTSSIVMNYTEWIYSMLVRWSRLTLPSLETPVSFQLIVSKRIWLVFIHEFWYNIPVLLGNQVAFSEWLVVIILQWTNNWPIDCYFTPIS